MRTDHVTGALRDKRNGVAVASYLSNSRGPVATGIPKAATEPDEGVVRMIYNLFRLAQSFPLSVVATASRQCSDYQRSRLPRCGHASVPILLPSLTRRHSAAGLVYQSWRWWDWSSTG